MIPNVNIFASWAYIASVCRAANPPVFTTLTTPLTFPILLWCGNLLLFPSQHTQPEKAKNTINSNITRILSRQIHFPVFIMYPNWFFLSALEQKGLSY